MNIQDAGQSAHRLVLTAHFNQCLIDVQTLHLPDRVSISWRAHYLSHNESIYINRQEQYSIITKVLIRF